MTLNDSAAPPLVRQRGVTLVELMVALALGLIVTLVVSQIMSFSEGQKRVTTGGADAQVNGALALYTLQREIQMAGYGLTMDRDVLGCPIKTKHATAGDATWTLAPVVITDGADGAPDTISLLTAERAYSIPLSVSVDHPKTGDRFVVRSVVGVAKGDVLIAVPELFSASNHCTLFGVTDIAGANQLVHAAGSTGVAVWNQDGGASIFPDAGYPAGTLLVNAGQIVNRVFEVGDQSLRQRTLNTASGGADVQDLFPQIVNLQALYGKDTDGNGVVDTYDNVTPTTNAGWRQVLAVRLAVVARSATYQKEEVTTAEPRWDVGTAIPVAGASDCDGSKCITLKIDGLVADWKHYRYSVFEVVAPLRNMLWGV
ncbi:PilW family protein [Azohydromonas sediminis]|uniref:PilW family protein n=1 Tax=Azohydromonas sediminis TaxID=2259674 RepID=UPI000E65AF3B|nr:PilW family protein [Azohydromonas sediminis]